MPNSLTAVKQIIHTRLLTLCIIISMSQTFWACSKHSLVGSMMTEYTVDHLAPYLLSTKDIRMACEMGVSMGPYLLSFERVMDPPDQAGVATLVTAALCAELRVWQHELRAARSFKQQRVADYKDALITQKRAHTDAARRYYQAYTRMNNLYAQMFKEECASIKDEDQNTQLAMVLGFVAGIQAVQHDRASQVAVGVPADIPRKISRYAQCLDNKEWWGVPKALQTALWLVLPNSAPDQYKGDSEKIKKAAYEILTQEMETGRKAGVRLVDAIFAQAAQAVGDVAQVKKIISSHATSFAERTSHKQWRLLDLTAHLQLQALSDKLWTQAKGHRTPHGELGSFWDEKTQNEAKADEEDDDLLDDLDE